MIITTNTLKRIDTAKCQSLQLIEKLKLTGLKEYAERITHCCNSFTGTFFYDKSIQRISVSNVCLCRVSICPICNVFKSRKLSRLIFEGLLSLGNKRKTLRFVTLTQKNCKLNQLHLEIEKINKAFGYFKRNDCFKNYLRKLEITFNQEFREFHPHTHLLVDSGYVSMDLIRHCWQKALRLDYLPVCNIKSVNLLNAHRELSKYMAKNSEIVNLSPQEIEAFVVQTRYKKTLTSGGYFSDYFQNKDIKLIDSEIRSQDEFKILGYNLDFFWKGSYYESSEREIINRSFEVFDRQNIIV